MAWCLLELRPGGPDHARYPEPCLASGIGSGEARERGVVGETPNLAARLQVLAQPNTMVIEPRDDAKARLGKLEPSGTLHPLDDRVEGAIAMMG